MKITRMLGLVFMSIIVASCASSYRYIKLEPKALNEMPSCIKDDNIEICVDAYTEVKRQQALFQSDFSNVGVLPVLIYITNYSSQTYRLRMDDILLQEHGGQVINKLFSGNVARAVTAPQGSFKGFHCVLTHCEAVLLASVAGIMASAEYATLEADRFDDYRSKEFKDTTLGPHKSLYGFIYFEKPLKGETSLYISVIEVSNVIRHNYKLTIQTAENK